MRRNFVILFAIILIVIATSFCHGNHKHEDKKHKKKSAPKKPDSHHDHKHEHGHNHHNHKKEHTHETQNDHHNPNIDHQHEHHHDHKHHVDGHAHGHHHDNDHEHHHHDHGHGHGHHHHHDHPLFILKIQKILSTFFDQIFSSYNKEHHGWIGALIVSLVPIPILLIIAIFRVKTPSALNLLSAFSLGALLGDVIFHNSGEIFSNNDSYIIKTGNSILDNFVEKEMFIIYGIVLMIFIEKIFPESHQHDHSNHKQHEEKLKNTEIIIAFINDFLHNFTDGIAIATTFAISQNLGISSLIGIVLHEIPHEVADFSFLLKKGSSLFISLLNQLLAALGAFAGVYLSKFTNLNYI